MALRLFANTRVAAISTVGAACAGVLLLYTIRRRRRRNPNFDKELDRSRMFTVKHDLKASKFGAGSNAISMWIADSDLPICSKIHAAIQERAAHPSFGYTLQPPELLKAVADWFRARHGWAVDPKHLTFIRGVLNAVSCSLRTFCKPGDAILVMTPLYDPLQAIVAGEGRRLIKHVLKEAPLISEASTSAAVSSPSYFIDFQLLEEQIQTEAVRMLILCSPHNPGGRVWLAGELQRLAEICSRHDVMIISDEIHADWCLFGHVHTPMAQVASGCKLITLGGCGKTFFLPGLQGAFAAIEDDAIREQFQAAAALTFDDEGGAFTTVAMLAAYRHGAEWLEDVKAYVEGNILLVETFIVQHLPEVRVWRPMATFLVWLDFRGLGQNITPAVLQKAIVDAGVILSPGTQFSEESPMFQRMNVACPRHLVRQSLERLQHAVTSLKCQQQKVS